MPGAANYPFLENLFNLRERKFNIGTFSDNNWEPSSQRMSSSLQRCCPILVKGPFLQGQHINLKLFLQSQQYNQSKLATNISHIISTLSVSKPIHHIKSTRHLEFTRNWDTSSSISISNIKYHQIQNIKYQPTHNWDTSSSLYSFLSCWTWPRWCWGRGTSKTADI